CSVLSGHYVQISLRKGGSHVVERCLQSFGMEHVLQELLKSDNIHELLQLARDRYGNYVVQTALTATKRAGSPSHGSLVWLLKQHSNALQSGYGSNVMKLISSGFPSDDYA
ncbi:putative pumilio homolog 7, chloroplastic, partial [Juglans microcarpa x Juglans regia]|uniref:putative pumilio homolog 7, chloroplastic n=1 Tax=Juglans microcarpa x Juglans regia TaxID=2249226 RepID=UPI001B7F2CBC